MKKTVAVVVVSLCCWLVASVGPAMCKKDQIATIDIVVGSLSFDYKDKAVDPVPCIYREGDIVVTVDFSAAANNQWLKLRNFRALVHANPGDPQGGSWIRDFDDLAPLDIQEEIGDDDWVDVDDDVLIFKKDEVTSKTIKLIGQRQKGNGSKRLITFQVALGKGQTDSDPDVTFDPPWGERP